MTTQASQKWNKVRFEIVADFNIATVGKKYPHTEIEYVDISSVETGILNGTTKYDFTQAPGRAKRIVKNGDTIVANVRPNRRSFYYFKNPVENLIVSTGFTVISPKEDSLNKRYAYYLISNQAFTDYLVNHAKGAAYPAVDTDTFKKAQVLIPDLKTQKQIADVLSAYDDLIENNNHRIKILEETAQKIYKEWFVNFRFPGYEEVKIGNDGLPDGWEVKNLNEIASVQFGYNYKADGFNEKARGVKVVRIRDILNGDTKVFSEEKVDEKYRICAGDILVGMDGIFHMRMWPEKDCYLVQRVAGVRSNLPSQFLLESIKTQLDYLQKTIMGATVGHLSNGNIREFKVLIPKDHQLLDIFEGITKKILNLQVLVKNLKKSRDFLIPQLVSGKLEIK